MAEHDRIETWRRTLEEARALAGADVTTFAERIPAAQEALAKLDAAIAESGAVTTRTPDLDELAFELAVVRPPLASKVEIAIARSKAPAPPAAVPATDPVAQRQELDMQLAVLRIALQVREVNVARLALLDHAAAVAGKDGRRLTRGAVVRNVNLIERAVSRLDTAFARVRELLTTVGTREERAEVEKLEGTLEATRTAAVLARAWLASEPYRAPPVAAQLPPRRSPEEARALVARLMTAHIVEGETDDMARFRHLVVVEQALQAPGLPEARALLVAHLRAAERGELDEDVDAAAFERAHALASEATSRARTAFELALAARAHAVTDEKDLQLCRLLVDDLFETERAVEYAAACLASRH